MMLRTQRMIPIVFLTTLIVVLAGTGYSYWKTREELIQLATPEGRQQAAAREVQETLEKLKKLAYVPDETPAVATITDVDRLSRQSTFYIGAHNGDMLVLFPLAKRAFIYSPSHNIVVNAGPLTVEEDNGGLSATESATKVPAARIEVRNGTAVAGAAGKLGKQLEAQGYVITDTTDAAAEYDQSLVIPLKPQYEGVAKTLAESLDATVQSSLPQKEASSAADLVVIIGK